MRNIKLIVVYLLFVLLFLGMPSSASAHGERLEYVRAQLVKSGVDAKKANTLVHDKRIKLYKAAKVSYKQPDWPSIEKKLLADTLIADGKQYMNDHLGVFQKAELDYGVSKEAIVGLIAMETEFGKNAGGYSVFNALYSRMRHASSTRWKGQAAQLIALSKYCVSAKIDCFTLKGSYAGAFGLVQFMPDSLQTYGVDGDGNGIVDLSNPTDAVPSAANFLNKHGWQDDKAKSLARYYGSSEGYPRIVLEYADRLASLSGEGK